jgi:hypothetical protein
MNKIEEARYVTLCRTSISLILQPFLSHETEGLLRLDRHAGLEAIQKHIEKLDYLEKTMKEHYAKSDIRFAISIFHNINKELQIIYDQLTKIRLEILQMKDGKHNEKNVGDSLAIMQGLFDNIRQSIEKYK